MPNPAFLIGPGPTGKDHRWLLDAEEFTVGRHAPADLVLPLKRISRMHARIQRSPQGYFLEDLESRNGTFVNGAPVKRQPHRLEVGDEIVLGGAITFRFDDPDQTATGPLLGRLKGVWIDAGTRSVWVDSNLLNPPLSHSQFVLLELLYQNEGQVITREQIIETVWPDENASGVSGEAVTGVIKRLRKRLREAQKAEKAYIEVIRGHGLRLVGPQKD